MAAIQASELSLGLLAAPCARAGGGQAGPDPDPVHLARLASRFPGEVGPVLVQWPFPQAPVPDARWTPVPARAEGALAGLDALLAACTTPWLLTIPLDVVDLNDCLVRSLVAGAGQGPGSFAVTAEGAQPWVALYRRGALAAALPAALAAAEPDPRALQKALRMQPVQLAGVRFGRPSPSPLPPLLGRP